jgi:hypothetical protein
MIRFDFEFWENNPCKTLMQFLDKINCLKMLNPVQTPTAYYDFTIAVCSYNQLTIVGHLKGSDATGG